jgi:Cullin family
VEDLCAHKMAARLYERLAAVCDAHIGAALAALAPARAATPDAASYLAAAAAAWRGHCDHILTIRNIFLHLDRSHVLAAPGLRGIWDLGLHLFRTHMARAAGVETKLVGGLLELVRRERDGEDVSRDLLQVGAHALPDCAKGRLRAHVLSKITLLSQLQYCVVSGPACVGEDSCCVGCPDCRRCSCVRRLQSLLWGCNANAASPRHCAAALSPVLPLPLLPLLLPPPLLLLLPLCYGVTAGASAHAERAGRLRRAV